MELQFILLITLGLICAALADYPFLPGYDEDHLVRVRRSDENTADADEYCVTDDFLTVCYDSAEEAAAAEQAVSGAIADEEAEDEEEEETTSDTDGGLIQARKGGKSSTQAPAPKKIGKKYLRWRGVVKMITHIVTDPKLNRKQIIKRILNYGCHCFPGQKKFRSIGGKGPAMDDLDGLCRNQYQCHKCVEIDMGCDPDETPYKVKMLGKKKSAIRDITCKDAEGTCGRALCDCDKEMAHNLADYWDINLHNLSLWRDKKNMKTMKKKGQQMFDYENTCRTTGMSPQPDKCCGNFPKVMPYFTATKSCCVELGQPKLFNPVTHKCCGSGADDGNQLVVLNGDC